MGEAVFDSDTDIEACIANCADTGTKNGLTVIISDFFTDSDWKKAVDYLLYKKRQIMLIQVLAPDEIDPSYDGRVHLIDAEAGDISDPRNMKIKITSSMLKAYEEALGGLISGIKDYCTRRGVDFISVSTQAAIEKVLFGEFFRTGILS